MPYSCCRRFFRRNAPDVAADGYSAVRVQVHLNQGAAACQRFIHGIVHDFIYHVVKSIYLPIWADSKSIKTVDGLKSPNGELSPIQKAFIEEAAVQCGFCTPF